MTRSPIEQSEYDLRCFLAESAEAVMPMEGRNWVAIPAKDTNQAQPKRPDLPYISVLKMDSWHLGIPYRTDNEKVVVVDTGNLYSVQFHGPNARDAAELVSIWIRSHDAYMMLHGTDDLGRPGQRIAKNPTFYIRNYSRVQDLTTIVNGKWEEKAVINMEVQHRIAIGQTVGQIDTVSINLELSESDLPGDYDDIEIMVEVT